MPILPWQMDDLYEDELRALWKHFGFKTQTEERSAFAAFAAAQNQADE